jgi:hypothetical protein
MLQNTAINVFAGGVNGIAASAEISKNGGALAATTLTVVATCCSAPCSILSRACFDMNLDHEP